MRLPAGLNERSLIAPPWIAYVRSRVHDGTCHTSTAYWVLLPTSSWPTARRVLAGFQATEETRPWWPFNVVAGSQLVVFHTITMWSRPPVASHRPSGDQERAATPPAGSNVSAQAVSSYSVPAPGHVGRCQNPDASYFPYRFRALSFRKSLLWSRSTYTVSYTPAIASSTTRRRVSG